MTIAPGHAARSKIGNQKSKILVAVAVLALIVLALLAWRAAPLALWAYNIQKAGELLETGIAWPEPRLADSLPTVQDESAIEAALGHLAAAVRWRPDHPYAHRLAGRAYSARGDWPQAIESYSAASVLAPDNPAIAWEWGLIYEQQAITLAEAATRSLAYAMIATGERTTPATPIETPFCLPGDLSSCYIAYRAVTLPMAAVGPFPGRTLNAIVTHPPVKLATSVKVPLTPTAFAFLLGLMPEVQRAGSDGAYFQVWVEPRQGEATMLYERLIGADEANAGWHPGWADLSAWAGQQVRLVLVASPGPAGDATRDWYVWGEPALRDLAAVPGFMERPAERAAAVWAPISLEGNGFLDTGQATVARDDLSAAARWYERVWMSGIPLSSADSMVQREGYLRAGQPVLAALALDRAILSDAGWRDDTQRREAFLSWAAAALDENRLSADEVHATFGGALTRQAQAELGVALVQFWRERGATTYADSLCTLATVLQQPLDSAACPTE